MKKKILFLISRFLDGGIDTILVEYLRNIPSDKYEVTLAIGGLMGELEVHRSSIPEEVKVVYLVENRNLMKIRKRKIKEKVSIGSKIFDEAILNPLRKIEKNRKLRPLIKNSDLIVDFDSTFYSDIDKDSAKKTIGFYHFSIAENLKRSARHTLRQMKGMADYRKIILISDTMVEEGKQLFPELSSKFMRIYNGYNIEELRKRAGKASDIQLPKRYFVAVERMEESQKDISTLIKAYSKAYDRYYKVNNKKEEVLRGKSEEVGFPSLVLVGEGRDRKRLQKLVRDLNPSLPIVFTGFVKQVYPIIKNSEALLHSSKYEGFGLVLAEGLILGKGVMSTDSPTGPAEVLANGEAGILVPVGDVEKMSEIIFRLATEPSLREELEQKALKRASTFDIKCSVANLLSLCKS